jgi:hypothetical protein
VCFPEKLCHCSSAGDAQCYGIEEDKWHEQEDSSSVGYHRVRTTISGKIDMLGRGAHKLHVLDLFSSVQVALGS